MVTPVDNIDSGDNPVKSVYCLLTAVFTFSIQDVIIKWISGNYPVHEIVLIRSCVAIFPILIIAYFGGGLHLLRIRNVVGHLARSFFMFAAYTCFFLALSAMPIAETVSLFFVAPIFITIISAVFLGDRVKLGAWIAVFTGFLGVVVMLKPGSSMVDPAGLLAVLSALFYAIASTITRKLGKTESGVSLAFSTTVMYIVFSMIVALILNSGSMGNESHPSLAFLLRAWRLPAQSDLLIFLVVGILAATGFYFQSQAYRLAKPSKIAPFEYIGVPLSVLWGYLIWKDLLELQSILGMLLIVGSGLYIFRGKKGVFNGYLLSLFGIKLRR